MSQYPLRKRASATSVPTHRAGHSSQIHPEDAPYWTDQRKKYPNPLNVADELDYPGEPSRMPSSAVRYIDRQGNTIIQNGNRRLVIHDEPPPKPKRRVHWAFIFWIGALAMLAFYLLWTWGGVWWTQHQLDATYGMPRTWQTDQAVGIGDSQSHPSHFIFENLDAQVLVIFFPGGDASKAKIYIGPQIFGQDSTSLPVTGEFRPDPSGRLDMIVHVGVDQEIVYINTGTGFSLQH
ncbi:MAG TPA: hypothetical protein VIZ18_04780 [Ktedonobacteraceae bacterium]